MTQHDRDIGLESSELPSPFPQGVSYIFAIGIDSYRHIKPLNNAVRDVEAVVELLTSAYQFDPGRVVILLNKEATRSNIHAQFRKLAQTVTKDDTLLIYFSGHGTYDKVLDEGYWIPVEGMPNDTSSYYSNKEIIGAVDNIRSFHTLIIADSCFSGKLFSYAKHIAVEERLESIPSRWAMTSGRGELVSDGPPGRHSPLAQSLLLHLQGAGAERLRISKLFDSVLEAVGSNYEQTPRCEPLQGVGHMGGEFVFRKKGEIRKSLPDIDPFEPDPVSPVGKISVYWLGAGVALLIMLIILGGNWIVQRSIIEPGGNSGTSKPNTAPEPPPLHEKGVERSNQAKPASTNLVEPDQKQNKIIEPNPLVESGNKRTDAFEPPDPDREDYYQVTFITNGVGGIRISFKDDEGKEYSGITQEGESTFTIKVPEALLANERVKVKFSRDGRLISTPTLDFSTGNDLPIPNSVLN